MGEGGAKKKTDTAALRRCCCSLLSSTVFCSLHDPARGWNKSTPLFLSRWENDGKWNTTKTTSLKPRVLDNGSAGKGGDASVNGAETLQ